MPRRGSQKSQPGDGRSGRRERHGRGEDGGCSLRDLVSRGARPVAFLALPAAFNLLVDVTCLEVDKGRRRRRRRQDFGHPEGQAGGERGGEKCRRGKSRRAEESAAGRAEPTLGDVPSEKARNIRRGVRYLRSRNPSRTQSRMRARMERRHTWANTSQRDKCHEGKLKK